MVLRATDAIGEGRIVEELARKPQGVGHLRIINQPEKIALVACRAR